MTMRIRRLILLGLSYFFLAACAIAQERGLQLDGSASELKPGHHYVVAIGIDHYQNWPVLETAESDAAGFAELLTKQFGFEFAADPLPEKNATRDHINDLLDDELRNKLKPEDDLVFFFAGHGTTRKDKIGERTESVGFLVPVDARAPGMGEHWSDYINVDELLRKISTLPSEHILVVLDSCHSGIALGGKFTSTRADTRFERDMLRKVSRKVITSAEGDQLAADNGPLAGHSLFTGLMMQGLTSGDADRFKQGFITSTQLGAFAQHEVGVHEGSRQTPLFGTFDLDDGGELIIPLGSGAADANNEAGLSKLEAKEIARIRAAPGWSYWRTNDPVRNFPAGRSGAVKLCEKGNGWGCWQAAMSFSNGKGGSKDFSRAVDLARQGCQLSETDSCVSLGMIVDDGETILPDAKSAKRIFQSACDQGNLVGCSFLGFQYLEVGEERNDQLAKAALKKACDGGLPKPCERLAILTSQSLDPTMSWYREMCPMDVRGCLWLGQLYLGGNGVKEDFKAAAGLFQKACDGGEQWGCVELGSLYRHGNGVPKDAARALALYQGECGEETNRSCSELGEMYEAGESVKPNFEKAVELYKKSCPTMEQGNIVGCWDLGRMYQGGKGVNKDILEAAILYRGSCYRGYAKACTALGNLYESGEGLSVDGEAARSLFDRACKDPDSDPAACERLKGLPPKHE